MVISTVLWLLSFIAYGFVFAQIVFSIAPNLQSHKEVVTLASIGLGPIFFSLVLMLLFVFFPAKDDLFYLICILVIWLILAALLKKSRRVVGWTLMSLTLAYFDDIFAFRFRNLLKVLVLVIVSTIAAVCLLLPLTANDPLEYAQVARILYVDKSLSNYPVVNSEAANGYYAPWSHPPVYVMLITWGYMIQGTAATAGIIKLTAGYFATLNAILIAYLLGRWKRAEGFLACLVFLTTPLIFRAAWDNSIDPLRIYAFFAVFILFNTLSKLEVRTSLIIGLTMGMALMCHSINILVLPIFVAIFLMANLGRISEKALHICLIVGIALVIVSPSYYKNFQLHGSIVSDVVDNQRLEHLKYDDYWRVVREVDSIKNKLFIGLLMGFTDIVSFGVSYYVSILSIILIARKRLLSFTNQIRRNMSNLLETAINIRTLSLFIIALFYSGVLLSIGLNMVIFIKNPRYIATVQPFIAICVGYAFALVRVWQGRISRHTARVVLLAFLSCVLLALMSYLPFKILKSRTRYFPNTMFSVTAQQKLRFFPSGIIQAQHWIKDNLAPSEKVLVFRPSDYGFYTNHTSAMYFDPKYLPILKLEEEEELLDMLKYMNIRYVYTPAYAIPDLYNSGLGRFLNNPEYVEIVFFSKGVKISRVRDQRVNLTSSVINEWSFNNNHSGEWTWFDDQTGFRYQNPRFNESSLQINKEAEIFHLRGRKQKVMLYSGRGFWGDPPSRSLRRLAMRGGQHYSASFSYKGSGLTTILLYQYSLAGHLIDKSTIWETVLSLSNDYKNMTTQFVTKPNIHEYRIGFVIYEGTDIELQKVRIKSHTIGTSEYGFSRMALHHNGWRVGRTTSETNAPTFQKGRNTGEMHDWGITALGAVYLKQSTNLSEVLASPIYQIDGKMGELDMTLSGKGNVRILLSWNCQKKLCAKNELHLGTFLLDNTPTNIPINLDRFNLLSANDDRDFPFAANDELSIYADSFVNKMKLYFVVTKSRLYRGTEHEYAEVYVHKIDAKYKTEAGKSIMKSVFRGAIQ